MLESNLHIIFSILSTHVAAYRQRFSSWYLPAFSGALAVALHEGRIRIDDSLDWKVYIYSISWWCVYVSTWCHRFVEGTWLRNQFRVGFFCDDRTFVSHSYFTHLRSFWRSRYNILLGRYKLCNDGLAKKITVQKFSSSYTKNPS